MEPEGMPGPEQYPFDPVIMHKNRVDMVDFSKWQLENQELVEGVFYILTGYHKELNKQGQEAWVKGPKDVATLSESGARDVQSLLYPLTQKNVLLSNLDETKINLFTYQTVGNIVVRLGSDPIRNGLLDEDGMPDSGKLYKVKDIVESTIYAALTRSNNYRTLEELNRGHQVHELLKGPEQQKRWSLFKGREGGSEYG